jgi:thioredoxin-like negative regulator of GroEL
MKQTTRSVIRTIWSLALLALISADDTQSEVYEFTSENYSMEKLSKGEWLLFFGSPTCPYCQQLLPTWKALAARSRDNGVITAAVNCLLDKQICLDFGISRYPTIFSVTEGNLYEFTGPRSLEAIEKFYTEGYHTVAPLRIAERNLNRQSDSSEISWSEIFSILDQSDLAWAMTPFAVIILASGVLAFKSSTVRRKTKVD